MNSPVGLPVVLLFAVLAAYWFMLADYTSREQEANKPRPAVQRSSARPRKSGTKKTNSRKGSK